jgi:hypothetical protein
MRRVGLIVSLAALLGALGGAATASPSLADGRGDGWTFNPPADFTVPAGFCPFDLQVTQPVDRSFTKAIKVSDGSMAFLTNGTSKYTFMANGKTITTKDSGSTIVTLNPDGSTTVVQNGTAWVGFMPADASRFGLPNVFVSSGKLTILIDPNGNITSISLNGHVQVDICAALS